MSQGNNSLTTVATPIIGIFAFVLALTVWLALPAPPEGLLWDDAWYLWMAEWFSGDESHRDVAFAMLQARQYPPVFPLILRLVGASPGSIQPGVAFNAFAIALSAALCGWLLLNNGVSWVMAVACSLLLSFNIVALTYMSLLISEPVFLLLSTWALILASGQCISVKKWFLIGVVAGLAAATRSLGWALVIALLIHLLQTNQRSMLRGYLPGVIISTAYFMIFSASLPHWFGYSVNFEQFFSNLSFGALLYQVELLFQGWSLLWGSKITGLLAAVLTCSGLLMGLRKGRAETWYILIYSLTVFVWPFGNHAGRFFWALLPAIFLCIANNLKFFQHKKMVIALITLFYTASIIAGLPEGLIRTVDRIVHPPGNGLNYLVRLPEWTRKEDRNTALTELRIFDTLLSDTGRVADLTSSTPFECIYSELPALLSIHTKRAVFSTSWQTLSELVPAEYQCLYYYHVPRLVPDSTAKLRSIIDGYHLVLFQTMDPQDLLGQPVAVFYKLNRGQLNKTEASQESK